MDVHLLPASHLEAHKETRFCWCRPSLKDPASGSVVAFTAAVGDVIVVHRASDGSELADVRGSVIPDGPGGGA